MKNNEERKELHDSGRLHKTHAMNSPQKTKKPIEIVRTKHKGSSTIYHMSDGSKYATLKPRGISKMFVEQGYSNGVRDGKKEAISQILEMIDKLECELGHSGVASCTCWKDINYEVSKLKQRVTKMQEMKQNEERKCKGIWKRHRYFPTLYELLEVLFGLRRYKKQ